MNAADGWLAVVGTGPGGSHWLTPETEGILAAATDLVGYGPYVDRVPDHGQRRHGSDNRQEMERARMALDLAAEGRRVAVVSGGDPGIFAMAAAIWEAIDTDGAGRWAGVSVQVAPAVSAMQAVAARAGAPLGNDFCVMSLSDNLKPWSLILRRIRLATEADFALAFYNPVSRARPWQLGEALDAIRERRGGDTPVVVGTAVGRPDERVQLLTLAEVAPEHADMRTLLIVGASTTRRIDGPDGAPRVYTPRYYPAEE
ncbi:MAG: precorrin-3B C(17)-methyltransferase [Halofilum sp. (in: g-proteobacteria)]|nr:precorrin-3B C(17)-methyltransferase [Halofilum sp. (in: g-proteobacteria)]